MIFIKNFKIFQGLYGSFILFVCIFYTIISVSSTPQELPEINDQFGNSTLIVDIITPNATVIPPNIRTEENEVLPNVTESRITALTQTKEESFLTRCKNMITRPILKILAVPKINMVLRNIGTCMVNGAMELITYYFPPPLIPLIATVAGMIIPFEPVVMLREKMPVTSYRRAFKSAINSFMGTFDRYKLDEEDDDPYMTRRFNRRLMNDLGEKIKIAK